jgi:hypothetical protein
MTFKQTFCSVLLVLFILPVTTGTLFLYFNSVSVTVNSVICLFAGIISTCFAFPLY